MSLIIILLMLFFLLSYRHQLRQAQERAEAWKKTAIEAVDAMKRMSDKL